MPLPRRSESGPPPASEARQFLYLDSSLTTELLAGLEKGVYEVEHVSTEETSGRQLGANVGVNALGAGLGVRGDKTTSVARRAETDLAQTSESQFARLVTGLRNGDALTNLETADPARLEKLRTGDVVEIVGSLTISDSGKLGTAVASFRAQARDRPADTVVDKARRHTVEKLTITAYNWLRMIPGIQVDPEVVATSTSANDVQFKGRLDAKDLRTKLDDGQLYGTVLAKLDCPVGGDTAITVIGIYR